ncbi:polyhydroxyalkanoate synthesis repressor PhaR [Lichenicoccus sp.]|uniref:polyhydroxyalkanoate synthesis repressor PhaR n=1 Tax=Lichenicoccus sp. TaxID=2781899 RepID=UPI003D12E2B7
MPEDDRPPAPIVVKKYANRRLYDTESSIYITLDTLAEMVRQERDFVVYDAKTGDDITRSVLTQIIMEEETQGRNMLPTAFLRKLIGFYGDSMQGLVPEYLERMMDQFSAQQRQLRASVQRSFQHMLPPEAGRQNLAMIERPMTMFTPFYDPGASLNEPACQPAPDRHCEIEEIAALRQEVARLRQDLARANAVLSNSDLDEPLTVGAAIGPLRH